MYEAGNVRTTESVLAAAAGAGVPRVLLASSSSVYGRAHGRVREDAPLRPLSHYGKSKQRAERVARSLAEQHEIELVVLRYFTLYGPRQRPDMAFARFVSAALEGGPMPLLGDGSQVRDFTYAGDAAEATARALERAPRGAVYNVAGGRPTTLARAFELLGDQLGRAPTLERHPADGRDPRSTGADLTRARRDLGWEPSHAAVRGARTAGCPRRGRGHLSFSATAGASLRRPPLRARRRGTAGRARRPHARRGRGRARHARCRAPPAAGPG